MTALNKQSLNQEKIEWLNKLADMEYCKSNPGHWLMSLKDTNMLAKLALRSVALLDKLEAAENNLIDSECHVAELEDALRDKQALIEAAEKRIAELTESHSKLRDTMAGIHNTIRMDGGYTPLAAILNAAKRAHEESTTAAGIGVKGE